MKCSKTEVTLTVITEPATFWVKPNLRAGFPAQSKAVAEPGERGLIVTITSFNTGGDTTKKISQKFTLRPGWRRQSLTHARMPTPTVPGPQTQATSLCLLDLTSRPVFIKMLVVRGLASVFPVGWNCLRLMRVFDFIFSLWLAVGRESSGWWSVCVVFFFTNFFW